MSEVPVPPLDNNEPNSAYWKEREAKMQDITAPEHGVEIEIREDGTVIWVHVNGVTALRICRIPYLVLTDHRRTQ
jgi:hypothetical protein